MLHALVYCFSGLTSVPAAAQAADPMKDLTQLRGEWEVVELVRRARKAEIRGARMIFTVEKMTLIAGDKREFNFKIDPTKKPKTIDITRMDGDFKGKKDKGIYHIEGDELKICVGNDGKTERPSEFVSPERVDILLFTLKRKK